MKTKWLRRSAIIVGVIVLVTLALIVSWKLWFDPYRGTVTAFSPTMGLDAVFTSAHALEDLDYIAARLTERHPACVKGLSDNVLAAYEREREFLAAQPEVSVLTLWQSAARFMASLGDAHTFPAPIQNNVEYLPVSFRWVNGALLISGGNYEGYTVLQINGTPVDEIYERFRDQFSYELEAWAQYAFATRLNRSPYLAFVGIDVNTDIQLVLENPADGEPVTASFALQGEAVIEPRQAKPFFEYKLDLDRGVGIFTLRQCDYNEEYRSGLRNFFTEVNENNIHSVIVDLRGNPGGNSLVSDEFVRYLPVESYGTVSANVRFGPYVWTYNPQGEKNDRLEPTFNGDVYILTSTDSFSSAMYFAMLISDNGLGTVIGEIPGNMPSSYGDILYFQTPNAGLALTVSHKYFRRPDVLKDALPLVPDIQVPAENALDEALRLIEARVSPGLS